MKKKPTVWSPIFWKSKISYCLKLPQCTKLR